ncbi:MAG: hypothetical protein AAF393_18550 [Pseudomonadota bacterium]
MRQAIILVIFGLAISTTPVVGDDFWISDTYLISEDLKVEYFDAELKSGGSLREAFSDLPKNLVEWDIQWDADCNVKLEISAVVPRLLSSAELKNPKAIEIKNAEIFEYVIQQARLARYSAEEVYRNNCNHTSFINEYWERKSEQLTSERWGAVTGELD